MTKPGPGKFQANASLEVAEELYEVTMNSGQVDDFGTSSDLGWFALIIRDSPAIMPAYIVKEDTSGFFTYTQYDTVESAREAFEQLRKIYNVEVN